MARDSKKDDNYYASTLTDVEQLVDKKQYEKALDILVEELSMPYIPIKYEEFFSNLFREVTIAIEEIELNTKFRTVLKEEEIIDALNKSEVEPLHLELAINSLKKVNIRSLLKDIKKFLSDEKKDDFIKTLVLIELVSQGVDEEIKIKKDDKTISLNPSNLTPLEKTKSLGYISRILEEKLFQDQTQQLIAFGIMQTILVFEYPHELELNKYDSFAAACHYMSSIYLRKPDQLDDIMKIYNVTDQPKVLDIIDEIQEVLDKRKTSFQNVI